MVTGAHQELSTSPVQQRLRIAAENVSRLETELKAERQLRDRAIVEAYEAHERLDTICRDAQLSRARILAIVGAT
jgi:hypothetical protein